MSRLWCFLAGHQPGPRRAWFLHCVRCGAHGFWDGKRGAWKWER